MPVILAAVFVGDFSYGISAALYITSAQALGATSSQVIFSVSPFFGVALSVLLLGEPLTWTHVGAGALFGAAMALLPRSSQFHAHLHKPLTHEHEHRHNDAHYTHGSSKPAQRAHSHAYTHETAAHEHPHVPDLHHLHDHAYF